METASGTVSAKNRRAAGHRYYKNLSKNCFGSAKKVCPKQEKKKKLRIFLVKIFNFFY